MKDYFKDLDHNKVLTNLAKVGIVIVGILIIFYIMKCIISCFRNFFSKDSKSSDSKVHSKNVAPPPPPMPIIGRSKSETLAINAFMNVLYEKGHDWRQVKAGYRHICLRNPTSGRTLEFDAYAEDLKIAIEYNGIQHYEFPNPFHKDIEAFKEGVQRDELKRSMCKDHGIKIIEIPYYIDTCISDGEGGWKYLRKSDEEKWELLKNYIEERI